MIELIAIATINFVLLHPGHATYAEVEWNGNAKRVEVALQLDLLDEQLIDRQLMLESPAVAEESTTEADQRVVTSRIRYLARHFRVGSRALEDTVPAIRSDAKKKATTGSQAAKYHWIGRQEVGALVWWYFEIDFEGDQQPSLLHQSILLDQNDRYEHRVLLLETKPPITLIFDKDVVERRWDSRHQPSERDEK